MRGEEWADRARSGDVAAWDEFVRECYDPVRRLCTSLVDARASEDLAQEAFTRAVRAVHRFRGECSERSWILSIAYRVCVDELRARGRRRRHEADAPPSVVERAGVVPDASDDVAMDDLVGRLDPDRRAAFVLTQIFHLSYGEAAVVCGCPVGTVRSRVARARDDLIVMTSGSRRARPNVSPARRRSDSGPR
jgi:RNA polymerase sigma-70 factor, ECF subfamily